LLQFDFRSNFFGAARFAPAAKLAYVLGKIFPPLAGNQAILPPDAPKKLLPSKLF